jgi:two-component system phosphate regulon sensor histidine kinase PhoR
VLHEITDLRRAAQMRRDFVANVSHELRTPLTAIRGYLEAVMDADTDAADARRFLETIARHTGRMERLIADLLRLARLDAGQEPLEVVECHVSELLEGVLGELAPTVDARRQRVTVRISPDDAVVTGDPIKLHEVLRNLIENAVLYAPEGSTIWVDAAAADGSVALRVADEGPGIPERDLTRIFERFYRVDKARSRESGGTGLGLSIVKHLVGLHRGEVSAANRPEGGAVFTVTLPQ